LLIIALTEGVTGGVEALPTALRVFVDFDLVNRNVLQYASDYKYSWIKGINETTRSQTQQAIADWIKEGTPLDALETKLSTIYSPARAERIAATEVTRVYAAGNQQAWESTEVVSAMKIQTAQDDLVCPICGPLAEMEIGIGDTDAMPPFHVSCRCYTLPVVSEDAVHDKIAKVLAE
jgi:SPP1 gp7 family putative phage head morphogenesis protein